MDKRLEVPQCQWMLVIALEGHLMVASMSIFSKASLEEDDRRAVGRASTHGIKMFLKCNKSVNAKWTAMQILAALEQILSQFISPARFVMLLPS